MSGISFRTVASAFWVVRFPQGALVYGVPSALASHLGKHPVSKVPQEEFPTCVFVGGAREVVLAYELLMDVEEATRDADVTEADKLDTDEATELR